MYKFLGINTIDLSGRFPVVIPGSVAVAMQPTQIQNNPEEEFLVSLKPWPGHFQILRFVPLVEL